MSEIYWTLAIVGSVVFILRLGLMLFGIGGADAEIGDTSVDHDGDGSFGWFSLHAIATLVMTFGWMGVVSSESFGLGDTLAVLIAFASGVAATYLLLKLLRLIFRLEERGNLDLDHAVGAFGTVYLGIGPDRPGQVQVTVDGRLLVLDARSAGAEELPTGTSVSVHAVDPGGVLVVSAAWSPL